MDIVLLAVNTYSISVPSYFEKEADHEAIQCGFVSSHFFFRLRHVMQPVFDRPFGGFEMAVGGVIGCFRGRPRGRFTMALLGDGSASSAEGAIFRSSTSSSSSSSIFGTMPSSLGASLIERKPKPKLTDVFLGDSLEEGEACEDELMLSLALVCDGAGPNTTSVAIRKEFGSTAESKAGGGGLRTLVGVGQCSQSEDGGMRSASGAGRPSRCWVESAGAEGSRAAAVVTVFKRTGVGIGGRRPPEESSRLQHRPTATVEGREGRRDCRFR